MASWIDRMLADGLARAEGLFAEEDSLGTLLWGKDGRRCYGRQEAGDAVLTFTGPTDSLTYVIVGMPLADLK